MSKIIPYKNIPAELRQEKRWLLWKLETRQGEKKPTKVPYQINGKRADSTAPNTWSTFEDVWQVYYDDTEEVYSGIGFVLGSPYVGIDLDNIKDQNGLKQYATEAIQTLHSYAEFSQSGNGIHIIAKGIVPAGGNRQGSVEIYGKDRYFVMTGEHVSNTPTEIRNVDLTEFHKKYILQSGAGKMPKDESRSNKQWTKLLSIANDFKRQGKTPTHDDLKLKYLNSVPYDAKFDSKRGETTWLDKDVHKVLREVFPPNTDGELIIVRGDEIKLRNIEWIWKPFLARGELTVFAGLPDGGKGTTVANIVATITGHRPFPGETTYTLDAQDTVLMFSAEESHDTTTLPRILAANGNRSKVIFVKGVEAQGRTKERVIRLLNDMEPIRNLLKQNPQIGLLVIDPIDCYFGGAKKNSAEDVTQIYGSLKKLAEDFNVAILIVDHLNKNGDNAAIHRISGAGAAGARPRLAWVFGKDKSEQNIRHIACLKGNILTENEKKGRKFFLKSVFIDIDGKPSSQSCVEWDGLSELDADDLLANPDAAERARGKAERFLRDLKVPTPHTEIIEAAALLSVSITTLNRAKKELGMISSKKGDEWFWIPLKNEKLDNVGNVGYDAETGIDNLDLQEGIQHYQHYQDI